MTGEGEWWRGATTNQIYPRSFSDFKARPARAHELGLKVDDPLEPLALLGNPSPQEGRWPVLSAMIGRL